MLGTHRTMTTGIAPGATPSATLTNTGTGTKLRLDLGSQVILVGLGANPREALATLHADLGRLLKEAA
jgi:hypothetical protein